MTSFARLWAYNGHNGSQGRGRRFLYTYTVYADVLWLVNFILDLALLWGTARFGGYLASWRRLALAAALGACYGVGLLFPALAPAYALPLPLLFSLLMLLAAFGRLPLRRWGWLVACFYLLAMAMGGAALSAAALLRHTSYTMADLAFALLAAALLARLGVAGFRRQLSVYGLRAKVEIRLAGRSCCLSCFFDTGNTLHEPRLSSAAGGRPVLLAELAALRPVLPAPLWEELHELYRREGAAARPYQLLLKYQRLPGLSLLLLPYAAVGEERGLLLGFVPERLLFSMADGRVMEHASDIVVGVCPLPLAGLKGCRALVNPEAVLNQPAAGAQTFNEPNLRPVPERGLALPELAPAGLTEAHQLPPDFPLEDLEALEDLADSQIIEQLAAQYGFDPEAYPKGELSLGLAKNQPNRRISA